MGLTNMEDGARLDDKVRAAVTHYEAAIGAVRSAERAKSNAKIVLIDALMRQAGLTIGRKITVNAHYQSPDEKVFLDGCGLTHDNGLTVYYRKVKENGEPYSSPSGYPTGNWTVGWGE